MAKENLIPTKSPDAILPPSTKSSAEYVVATELGILGEILQYVVEKNVMIVWTKDFAETSSPGDCDPGSRNSAKPGNLTLRESFRHPAI